MGDLFPCRLFALSHSTLARHIDRDKHDSMKCRVYRYFHSCILWRGTISSKINQGYIFIFRCGAEKIGMLLKLNLETKFVRFICIKYPNIRMIHAVFVHADKTKYTFMSWDQNAGRNHSVKSDNRSFERVEEFRYLGKPLTNKILFRKKLRADWSQGMFAIIRCTIFCLPVCYPIN